MNHVLDDFTQLIPGKQKPSATGRMVCCPAHKDTTPSMETWIDPNGKVAWFCYAGCTHQAVLLALPPDAQRIAENTWKGQPGPTLQIPTHKPRPATTPTNSAEAEYVYTDEHGTPLFIKRRYPGKKFAQYQPDGTTGRGAAPDVLYRLTDINAAIKNGDPIFIVEGEKDADRLSNAGLTATTNPDGAGKWRQHHTDALKGAHVIIIPDNDQPGWNHAEQLEQALLNTAATVKTVVLPVSEKGDVSDWFDQKHTPRELLELAADTPTIQPPQEFQFDTGDIIYTAAQPDPIWGDGDDLLWTREEPLMIYGPTGLGKTTIAGQLALSLIGIGPTQLLGHTIHPLPPDKTILYVAADRPRQAMRSLRRMVNTTHRETLTRRLLIERRRQISSPEGDVTLLLRAAKQANAGVVILDSAKDIAGGPLKEEAPAKALMDSIQHCIAWNIDVILLHHTRKASQDRTNSDLNIDDVYGSTWITAGMGSVIAVTGTPGSGILTITHLKAPSTFIDPMDVAIDYDTGQLARRNFRDLIEFVRNLGTPVGRREIAAYLNARPAEDVTEYQMKKAQKRADSSDQLVRVDLGGQQIAWMYRGEIGIQL